MIPLAAMAAIAAGAAAGRWGAARLVEHASGQRLVTGPHGIIPGAEAIDLPAPGAQGVLLLHGFGDTPQTLSYLAEHLNERGLGVRVPLLPGHGRSLREFAASRAEDWMNAAHAEFVALRRRYSRTGVVGLSMGGALSILLAAEHTDIPVLGLVAPYVDAPPLVRRIARGHRLLTPLVPYLPTFGGRSIRSDEERAKSLAYGIVTGRLLHELVRVVDLADAALPSVLSPTLVVHSREDHRIPPRSAERSFERLGAAEKRLVWNDDGAHVLTVDVGRQGVIELLADWLTSRLGEGPRILRRAE